MLAKIITKLGRYNSKFAIHEPAVAMISEATYSFINVYITWYTGSAEDIQLLYVIKDCIFPGVICMTFIHPSVDHSCLALDYVMCNTYCCFSWFFRSVFSKVNK